MVPYLITPPSTLVVPLDVIKAHLRIDFDQEDSLITSMAAAAIDHLDGYTGVLGRALAPQVWGLDMECFPSSGLIRLPFIPLRSLTLSYYDESGVLEVLDPDSYWTGNDHLSAFVVFKSGFSWPMTQDRPDAVKVVAEVGYASIDAVPEAIKAAILLIIGDLYQNREAKLSNRVSENSTVQRLIAPYRAVGV